MNESNATASSRADVDALERRFDDLSYEDLASRASDLRARINRFRLALGRYFVGKQPLIDLMTKALERLPKDGRRCFYQRKA